MYRGEIRVRLGGAEIAKWVRGPGMKHCMAMGEPVADGIFVVHADPRILVDLAEKDLPYLDPHTEVEFGLGLGVIPEWRFRQQYTIPTYALFLLRQAGVPVDETEKLAVEMRGICA